MFPKPIGIDAWYYKSLKIRAEALSPFTHTYVLSRAGIFKPLWSPGIDAKASIPPAYVAWRAGTITLFLLGA